MIFTPSGRPRLFGLPPGADFATALAEGLTARAGHLDPLAFARIEIVVNTQRMRRRLTEVFARGPARLLPRIRLVTDLALDPAFADLPAPVAPLRRRLELTRLVAALLDAEPDLAPRAALFDLADSLAELIDEMQGEGVPPERLAALDVSDLSGHWARALRFLTIAEAFLAESATRPDREARQRQVIERLADRWRTRPPDHPVLVAGSTGSRGATALFMQAVAALPQGAVILPGFDFDMPQAVWHGMTDALAAEDHPQFRFRRLLDALGLAPDDVARWSAHDAPAPARNRLVSLSLRPAPVTDQWRREGPALPDIAGACAGVTLLEASSPRQEAEAIALGMRQAIEDGRRAALVTPDRMLTRQVAAALDRWNVTPDDSAGLPLPLSAPGRFLRHVADLFGRPLTGEALLVLLKHPLCHSGPGRGDHLRLTHELELHLRRNSVAFPGGPALAAWAAGRPAPDPRRAAWAGWLSGLLDGVAGAGERPLADHVAAHLALAEALAAGPDGAGSGALWDAAAGREALRHCTELRDCADAGGTLSPQDYATLFGAVMNRGEVRDRDAGHPLAVIWGTLEARVQGADLVILGGLNEGSWPEAPPPDPWLNRRMRVQAGLLLPERRIGLSAHDYQQAVAGAEVWLTRARRSDDAETVPSRWLNRLTNLLDGLPETGGRDALAAMRARGAGWLARAAALTPGPVDPVPAPRPSPRPPAAARPRRLSVTQIKTLVRDPYAIYARKILRLKPLDPLVPGPDAPLRGEILHRVLERFVKDGTAPDTPDARAELLRLTDEELATACPWPATRRLWRARMARVAGWFLATETARRARATPEAFETWGEIALPGLDFILGGKADRIDRAPDGRVILYDYKTGQVPTRKQQQTFDKQLLLEAAMAARGAFAEVGPAEALDAVFIGVGGAAAEVPAPLDDTPPEEVWAEFQALIRAWRDPSRGYSARPFPFEERDQGDYDHLARRGEWNISTDFTPEDLE